MPGYPDLRQRYISAPWKGKAREVHQHSIRSFAEPGPSRPVIPRDEGNGGQDGAVISLSLVGDGVQESVYTLPISLGSSSKQTFNVQIDTGSSDLWLASTDCSSDICSGTKRYNPSSAHSADKDFDIKYLKGEASGPIYWDELDVGGYSIASQALAAVSSLASEPLNGEYSGVLGLALPSNSIIEQKIGSIEGNAPDGATFASNLFGITPSNEAPAARFLSLALQRPGMDDVPSVMGIGRHPEKLVPDPSAITYSPLVRTDAGFLFWQSNVRNITVYVNGTALPITLPRSTSGAAFPTAVLDTGVPFILSSTQLANAIYGALGVGPGSDGQYYIPCSTPLNMTISLYGQKEQPLHPLDLTSVPPDNPTSDTCVGMIQTAQGALDSGTVPADMILGVPFLRNVYTVMAYDTPFTNGSFPNATGQDLRPQLGILSLLNINQALQEFNKVRVLGQPLASNTNPKAAAASEEHGMSIGIKVLIGIVSFVGLCALLFGGFFLFMRRRWRARVQAEPPSDEKRTGIEFSDFPPPRPGSRVRDAVGSSYTDDTNRTHVGTNAYDEFGHKGVEEEDKGVSYLNLDPWDTSGWRTTVTSDNTPAPSVTYEPYEPVNANDSDPEAPTNPGDSPQPVAEGLRPTSHVRSISDSAGVTSPLIAHTRDASRSRGLEDAEATELRELPAGTRTSMVGVGTAHGRRMSVGLRHDSGDGALPPPTGVLIDASSSPRRESFAISPSSTFARPAQVGRSISPRPISLNARFPTLGLGDVPASDFDFLARRSHAFNFEDPPTPSSKRGRKA